MLNELNFSFTLSREMFRFSKDFFHNIATQSRRDFQTSTPLFFHFIKKQVMVDPELAKLQEKRKRRKLEAAIKKLEEFSQKPKPVEEMQIDIKLRKTLNSRTRETPEISEEERQRRIILLKAYSRTRAAMSIRELRMIKKSMDRQKEALSLLKHLSPELYEAAIQPDDNLLPFQFEGPPLTPPIENYKSPDGEYIDITKKWVQPVLPALDKKFGIGKLIKAPAFQKEQQKKQQQHQSQTQTKPPLDASNIEVQKQQQQQN